MFGKPTDEALVARALEGSERAWFSLVKRYERRLYNYGYRMTGSREDAMDIVQDVLMSVYRNLAGYRGDGVFAAWLFRIASYRCTDYLRRRGRQPGMDEADDIVDEGGIDLERVDSNAALLQLMGCLSKDQREVIELKFFQGFTFEEISMQLGISSNTAKSRIYAALRKMKPEAEDGLLMKERA